MRTKERSIWLIDRIRNRILKVYSYLWVIWTGYIILVVFNAALLGAGFLSFKWHVDLILPILGIWFAIISLWPDAVFAVQCRAARLHPDTESYAMEARRQIAWELKGKRLKETAEA